MDPQKQIDLDRLSKLAFRRMGQCAKVITKYYAAPARVRADDRLKKAYPWLFVPFSLWLFDVSGAVEHMIHSVTTSGSLDEDSLFLLNLLGDLPIPRACATVEKYEHQVKGGNYEALIRAQHKFDLKEKLLAENAEFRDDWNRIKRRFNIARYRSENGVIRRKMVSERNFRPPGWDFKWKSSDDRFRAIFDAFCHKWVLYGMEYDKPLLQKLSVNITPFGTMIFIPRYWSLDRNRDLRWSAINRLHNARGVPRQGAKLSANQIERKHEAASARRFWNDATEAGLRGEKRTEKVLSLLGWHPEADPRQLRRLLKLAPNAKPNIKSRPST